MSVESGFSSLPQNWRALARKYGTPLFVLSLVKLRKQLETLKAAWSDWVGSPPQYYFPLKANDFIPFLRLMHDYGLGLDITESGEIDIALRDVGFAPTSVVINGPAKERHLLQKAIRNSIRIHVDSFDELQEVRAVAADFKRPAQVGIRLRFGEVSKFGFSPADQELQEALLMLARSPELSLVAIHQHDPVSLNSTKQLESRLTSIATFIEWVRTLIDHTQMEVDLGGGLNLNSGDGEFRSFRDFVDAFTYATNRTGTQRCRFGFEWGRAIVGPCGSVISKIVRKKESQGSCWIYLDAGQNIIGGRHANVAHTAVSACETPGALANDARFVNLAGPLCFTSDVIGENFRLPHINHGDMVLIGEAGAYTLNTRWHGPGKDPVMLLESDSGVQHIGRLRTEIPKLDSTSGLLTELFHLFFAEEFSTAAERASGDIAFGISSGTNQLDPPDSLKGLLSEEINTCEGIKTYTGPYGSDEIIVSALAFEEALAATGRFHRDRCAITLGAAQACARAFDYLFSIGHDHCVLVGPQYPLIYDLLRKTRFEASELIGGFEAGYLPTAECVVNTLHTRPRSVLFLTVPNNPAGTCPTEDWLSAVFQAVNDYDGHVIIDRSSEDLPLEAWVRFSPTTMVAARVLCETAYTIVNTVSKSRSIPGLRLGYLLGSEELVNSVANFNYNAYLSTPRAGTRVVCGDLILRSLWWRHERLGQPLGKAVDIVGATVCRSDMPSITDSDFAAIIELYPKYVDECASNLRTIKQAQCDFIEGLQEYWIDCTPQQNGFNVIAEILSPRPGVSFSKALFRATGIRLLPSECFSLEGLALQGSREGLTFRLSSADEPRRLRAAAETLREYLRGIHS